jgi:hypothetical protein
MSDSPLFPVYREDPIPKVTPAVVGEAVLRLARSALVLLAGTVLCVSLLGLPNEVAGPSLDQSWGQALGFFLKNRLQAGRDYVFTFGPLGYFFTQLYDGDLFWCKYVWELGMKFFFAALLLRLGGATLGLAARLVLCLLAVACLHDSPDGFYAFFLFLLGVRQLTAETFSPRRLLGHTFLLATIGLIKFTFLADALLVVAISSALLLRRQPRARVVLPWAFFGGWFLAWWCFLGQGPANVPAFLRGSLEVAAGYNEGMAIQGDRLFIYLALALLGMLAATLVHRSFLKPPSVANVLRFGFVATFLFLQWKHGFVRQDAPNPGCHMASLFAMTLLCPFFFPALFPTHGWGRGARLVLVSYTILLSVVGFFWVTVEPRDPELILSSITNRFSSRLTMVLHPEDLQSQLEARKEELRRQCALPQIGAQVKDATIDAFSYEQGVVLLNQWHWHPRPIFQGYFAYTPLLQAANASFLAGRDAPAYVLFKLQSIDGKLPTQEDGQALLELLKRYLPILRENDNLLLARKPAGAETRDPPKVIREAVVRFDQEVEIGDLSAEYQVAKVQFKYTRLGQVRKALFKPPMVFIRLRTEDHQELRFRLTPAVAQAGFLLNPLLLDMDDVVRLYTSAKGKRVVSFCITTDDKGKQSYEDAIGIAVTSESDLAPTAADAETVNRLRYPMMKTVPETVVSSVAVVPIACNGRNVLVVHPQGEVRFQVGAGTHRARGQFGMLPDAYEKGHTDGARFTVEFLPDEGAPCVLLDQTLDPVNRPEDRGFKELDLELTAQGKGRLVFRTSSRPGKTMNWGWSFWTGLEIE